jgi:hypothetical protein
MKKPWVFIIRLALVSILVCCLAGTFFLYLNSYQDFTAGLFTIIGQSGKLEKFRTLLLTQERFLLLRLVACAVTLLTFLALLYLWHRAKQAEYLLNKTARYIRSRIRQLNDFWQHLPFPYRYITIALFVLILVSRLYFVFRFPFHVDERFTYLYFVHKGLAVSMAYYPGPNNHILFTLICNLFDTFIDNPLLVMKLPALLIGLVLLFAFWFIVSKYLNYLLAIATTALFAFAEPVFYYSLQGRGYALLMLFVLLASHAVIKIANAKTYSFSYHFWFWLSCTLGFYTIPIFLYPFLSLILFASSCLLIRRKHHLFNYLLFTSVGVVVIVSILYLPVIIFNGWKALAGNTWVTPAPWPEFVFTFPQHIQQLASGSWGALLGGEWISLLTVVCSLAIIISKRTDLYTRQWMLLYILNIAVVLGMSLLQRLLLPVRVIYYMNIYQYVVLVLVCTAFINSLGILHKLLVVHKGIEIPLRKQPDMRATNYRPIAFIILCVALACLNICNFNILTSPHNYTLYNSFDATAQWLYQHNANIIFVNDYDYSLCIRFQYETQGREVLIETNQTAASQEYNYLVVYSGAPFPDNFSLASYKQVFEDTIAVIYEKHP